MHTIQGLKYHKYSEGVTRYIKANIRPIYSRKFGREVQREWLGGGGWRLAVLQEKNYNMVHTWFSFSPDYHCIWKHIQLEGGPCIDLKTKLFWCTPVSVCQSTMLWILKCSVWADNSPFPYQLCFGFQAHCQRVHSWESHTGHVKNTFFIIVLFSSLILQ